MNFFICSVLLFCLCCREQRREFSLAGEIHVLVSRDVTFKPPANKKAVLDKYGSNNQQRETG